MELLLPLWLPILLVAGVVWLYSIIAPMALPHHRRDWIGLSEPDEASLMDELRKRGIAPGNYLFPDFRDPKSMKTEKVQRALREGPVGHLSLWKTPLTMGDKMVSTAAVFLLSSTLIAYLTRIAIPGPAGFAQVFRFATAAGVLAYCFSFLPAAIWWGSYKRTIIANIIDGVLCAAITGAILAWRWPR